MVGPEGLAGEPGKPGRPGLPGVGKPGLPVSVLFLIKERRREEVLIGWCH